MGFSQIESQSLDATHELQHFSFIKSSLGCKIEGYEMN